MENVHSEFEKLLEEESANIHFYSKGETVKGKIVKIHNDVAFVDIGQKTEVVINKNEIEGLAEGDEIEAVYLGKKNKEGYNLISRKPLIFKQALKNIEEAYNNQKKIKAKLISKTKAGFSVDIAGIRAFMPFSESGLKKGEEFPPAEFNVYILKFEKNKKPPNIVVSRKQTVQEELEKKKNEIINILEEGKIVRGKVVKIQDKGAVLILENVLTGFLPNSLFSWDKNKKLQDELNIGDELEVLIKNIDKENRKILFSRRELEPNPWNEFDKKVGDIVECIIKEINEHGIIVKVGKIEGFIYKLETDHLEPLNYRKKFKPGQKINAKIIELDKGKHRLKLSIKATTLHPVDKFLKENPEGSVVEGKIKELKTKIAIIDLGNRVEGILHLEDATWNPKIRNIGNVFKGKSIKQFKVLGKETNNKIKLGLKQFKENPWKRYLETHKEGDIVEGKIIKLIDRGAFVELDNEVEGFIPVSQISKERIDIPSDKLSLGQIVKAKITKIKGKDIILSIKALENEQEKQELKKVLAKTKSKGDSLGTLGDILKEKLKGLEK